MKIRDLLKYDPELEIIIYPYEGPQSPEGQTPDNIKVKDNQIILTTF